MPRNTSVVTIAHNEFPQLNVEITTIYDKEKEETVKHCRTVSFIQGNKMCISTFKEFEDDFFVIKTPMPVFVCAEYKVYYEINFNPSTKQCVLGKVCYEK